MERSTGESAEAERVWSTAEATWVEGQAHRLSDEEALHHRRLLTLFASPDAAPERAVEFTHPRLGTTIDRATYDERSPEGVATAVSIDFHDGSIAWRGSLALEGVTSVDGFAVPDAPPAKAGLEPSISKIRDGLWDVRLPGLDARSFVVEFESFVVTVEAPWSSSAGEQAVDLIAGKFPDKPIRYALYTHHHPHASGGLRAFMAAGATVVAPTAHAAYLNEVIGRDFSLAPRPSFQGEGGAQLHRFRRHVHYRGSRSEPAGDRHWRAVSPHHALHDVLASRREAADSGGPRVVRRAGRERSRRRALGGIVGSDRHP